jgi:uncharacterized membrane protein
LHKPIANQPAFSFLVATSTTIPTTGIFVYFLFAIGMTVQVSDVGITDKTIRRSASAI